jgi:hypothetical protein
MSKPTPTLRPGAGGHRFGPDLICGECGRNWDDHQHDPAPCEHESPPEPAAVEAARARPTIEWITVGVPGEKEAQDEERESDEDA